MKNLDGAAAAVVYFGICVVAGILNAIF